MADGSRMIFLNLAVKDLDRSVVALSADSREQVDELADKALEIGGTRAVDPIDMGFMYSRSFHDPDGHQWELVWMDPSAAEQQ